MKLITGGSSFLSQIIVDNYGGTWDSYGVETDSCFFQVKASIVPPTVI